MPAGRQLFTLTYLPETDHFEAAFTGFVHDES